MTAAHVRIPLLDCPGCGEPCKGMPPHPPEHPAGIWHWVEGDEGTCACGASLSVYVDDGVAELREEEDS